MTVPKCLARGGIHHHSLLAHDILLKAFNVVTRTKCAAVHTLVFGPQQHLWHPELLVSLSAGVHTFA